MCNVYSCFSLVISCFEKGVTIFICHFLNSVLLMFCMVKSCKIISPSMEHKHDNVMYMLCTLVEQCQVVKCLNICHLILIKSF
jgi:hypothetical protein